MILERSVPLLIACAATAQESKGCLLALSAGPTLRTGEIHWRSINRDNITTLYGKDNKSRIFDPASWIRLTLAT